MPKILLIEDDVPFATMLKKFLERHRFEVETSSKASDSRILFNTKKYDLVLCDLRLPDAGGIELLTEIKSASPNTHVILMTGYAEVGSAVSAMKKGAYDYISKPFTPDEMLMVINSALASVETIPSSEKESNFSSESFNNSQNSQEKVSGNGTASKKLQEHLMLVAPTNLSVLIMGESGTGKEVTARTIHENSQRKKKNFVAVDCGAIPKELASSEFFGHVKGSFTGAINDKTGYFEAANGGTLFLDEIGNLTYENQVKLLRAIQERKIKKVGSTKEVDLDVRIITATNEDLQVKVDDGLFREDLYHRLNEFSIEIPPLRERFEDLIQFAQHFLNMANTQLGKSVSGFSEATIAAFQKYSWPGNLRELQNVIKRSVLLCQEDKVQLSTLPKEIVHFTENGQYTKSKFSKSEFEKDRIIQALKQTNFNKTKAAKLLEMTRKTLYNKIEHYGLEV